MPFSPVILSTMLVDKLSFLWGLKRESSCGVFVEGNTHSHFTNVPSCGSIFSMGGHWNCNCTSFESTALHLKRSSKRFIASLIVVAFGTAMDHVWVFWEETRKNLFRAVGIDKTLSSRQPPWIVCCALWFCLLTISILRRKISLESCSSVKVENAVSEVHH